MKFIFASLKSNGTVNFDGPEHGNKYIFLRRKATYFMCCKL